MKDLIKLFLGRRLMRYLAFNQKSKSLKQLIVKRRLFYLQFLKNGDLFFDVGANNGNRIEPIVDSGIRIVAIEPQEICATNLRRWFGDKIQVIQKGLGEEEETRTMHISNINVLSSFSDEWIEKTNNSGRFNNACWPMDKQVEMITLDILIEEFGVPKFIKIDVEGFELEVLKGLSRPVEMISYEYTVPEQTDRALMCLDRIINIMGNEILCNYSKGESMEWALDDWTTPNEMEKIIKSSNFRKTGFGDLYIRCYSEA